MRGRGWRIHCSSRCLFSLFLLLVACGHTSPSRAEQPDHSYEDVLIHHDDAHSRAHGHENFFFRTTLNDALGPWEGVRVSSDAFARKLADARHPRDGLRLKLVGAVIHGGRLLLTTWPLDKSFRYSSWSRFLLDLHALAADYPELSVEFLLHFGDSPAVPRKRPSCENIRDPTKNQVPVFGFDRWGVSLDVPTPHYYIQPDAFCHPARAGGAAAAAAEDAALAEEQAAAFAAAEVPWEERENRLIGRFSHFCLTPGCAHLFPKCQRTHFSNLTQALGSVGSIQMDVAPTNEVNCQALTPGERERYCKGAIKARPAVRLREYAAAKYILVTEGWSSAGSLANALAMGSVVLLPTTFASQYFEPALVPKRHFVPLWVNGEDDIVEALRELEADPERAARIAAAGRRFACGFLTERARRAFWHKLLLRYARENQGYGVSYALLRERQAEHRVWVFDPRDVKCRSLFSGNYCTVMGEVGGLETPEDREEEARRWARDGIEGPREDGWWDGGEWHREEEERPPPREDGILMGGRPAAAG